jgi:hypothetical protein
MIPRAAPRHIIVRRGGLLFLKKKKQKDFYPLGAQGLTSARQTDKNFLLLFFKKEDFVDGYCVSPAQRV